MVWRGDAGRSSPGVPGREAAPSRLLFLSEGSELRAGPDGTVLVHPTSRRAFRVDEVAAWIIGRLWSPIAATDLCDRAGDHFDVEPEECSAQVGQLLDRLAAAGLLDGADDPCPSGAMRRRYLDLLKRALVNLLYPDHELRLEHLEEHGVEGDRTAHQRVLRDLRYAQREAFADLVDAKREGRVRRRRVARDSHTMVGLRGLDNLERCAVRVFADEVPGDFLEAGVCQGGAAIFLRALQVAYGQPHRVTWAADSFEGLPAPIRGVDGDLDFTERRQPWLAASLRSVRDNFRTYDLLDDHVRFIPGWFAESLPPSGFGELAILRIDADLPSSTTDVLRALYDRVAPGGFVVVDDYWAVEGCRLAVDAFLAGTGSRPHLHRISWAGVCWRKDR